MSERARESEAKLLFVPEFFEWIVEDCDDFRRVEYESDTLVLSSFLTISISEASVLDRVRGTVRVSEEDSHGCSLEYFDMGQREERAPKRILSRQVSLAMVRWTEGLLHDSWLECDSVVHLESVRSIAMRLYLPKRADSRKKLLTARVGETVVGEFELVRDDITEIRIDHPSLSSRRSVLRLSVSHPEPNIDNGDVRSLGCLLASVSVNDLPFQPPAAAE